MRRSDWEDRCRRHPEHRLSKGVCPGCLRDRLTHLSASFSATTTMTRASNDSASTSSPYSLTGSPPLHHHASAFSADASSIHVAGGGSSFVNVSAFSQPLMPTASKKPAGGRREDAARPGKEGEAKKKKKSSSKKKIGRFLSRLVGSEKRRRTGDSDGGELFHSSTMKEKTSTKWVFF